MSFANDMLAEAQAAYKDALKTKSARLNGRGKENHDITQLRNEVEYWQAKVDAETARASGSASRKPIQVVVG